MDSNFEKITSKKKYALNNSYFKNRSMNMPANPYEVWQYYKEHKELPYNYDYLHSNRMWYDCFCEYQKRYRIECDQFFTPPEISMQLAEIIRDYSPFGEQMEGPILDLCCGYGQLTFGFREILPDYEFIGVDTDRQLCDIYEDATKQRAINMFFQDYEVKHDVIIANPPFSQLEEFFEKLDNLFKYWHSVAFVILPLRYVDKVRPKRLFKSLMNYRVTMREQCIASFAQTGQNTEIVALEPAFRNDKKHEDYIAEGIIPNGITSSKTSKNKQYEQISMF